MRAYQRLVGSALLTGICFGNTGQAEGSTDFGTRLSLTSHAAVENALDIESQVATDGSGTWVAVWLSDDTSVGIQPGKGAPLFSRSIDDGATWSDPALPRPEFADDIGRARPSVATDGNGKWMIAWSSFAMDPVVTVSSDDGATWAAPVPFVVSPTGVDNDYTHIATDSAGTWLLVWQSDSTLGGTIGSEGDILFSRSTDDGGTWSTPAPLNTDAAGDLRWDTAPRLATDSSGVWVVVWDSFVETMMARSADNGASWSPPVALSTGGDGEFTSPDVATDGVGRWVAVWEYGSAPHASVIAYASSNDNGATWSAASPIHSYFGTIRPGDDLNPCIAFVGPGEWQIVWWSTDKLGGVLGSNDADLLTSYSRDDGQSWTTPAALTVRARRDGIAHDQGPAIAHSVTGRTIVVSDSQDSLNGTIGTDLDILFVGASRDCAALAREDCLTSTEPDGSKLTIRDASGGSDRLVWRLKDGQATSDANLGDPTTTDSYVLCLYEKLGGSPGLIAEWDARAATTCRDVPCWTDEPGRVELRDSGLEQGSIKRLSVRGGASGEASIRLTASGPALSPPRLPLDTTSPIRIQLVNLGTNACWEGVHDQADTNAGERFVSTSD